MKTEGKATLVVLCIAIAAGTAVGLYFYFKGKEEISTEVTNRTEEVSIATTSMETKDFTLDESFKGTIREGDNENFRLGNLTYRKHIADLSHEQNILAIRSTETTVKIAIAVSAGLLILTILGVIGYKVYKLKADRNSSNSTQHGYSNNGPIRYNVNDPNNPVIYRQNGSFNNGPYRFQQPPAINGNRNQYSNNENGKTRDISLINWGSKYPKAFFAHKHDPQIGSIQTFQFECLNSMCFMLP